MIFFVGHALSGWMPEMLHTGPWSTRGAAWLTAGGITVGVIGSLIIPSRVKAHKRPQVLILMFAAMAVAVWALMASSQTPQIFAVAVIGIVRVSSVPMAMLLLMSSRSVPDARMGVAGGLFSPPVNSGECPALGSLVSPAKTQPTLVPLSPSSQLLRFSQHSHAGGFGNLDSYKMHDLALGVAWPTT